MLIRNNQRFCLILPAVLALAILALAGSAGVQTRAGAETAPESHPPAKSVQTTPGDWELLRPLQVEHLANGMTFLLYPNHRAPVVSGVIRFDVGGKDEVPGMTGIAHMFEHMAFKGTPRIGTRDWPAEQAALKALETASVAYDEARNRIIRQRLPQAQAEPQLKPFKEAFDKAKATADRYVVKNEFDEIYSREGGSDMNASTAGDATTYYISLPANRLPLWAKMESQRLSQPVMREFYSERDVVMEERRMRNDMSPIGQLWEQTMAGAFTASPYHYPVIGYESDIRNLKANQAYEFFKTHYTPDRAVGVLVGNFDVEKTRQLLRETFGKIAVRQPGAAESRPLPEPPQKGERRITLRLPATPMLLLAWHKPNLPDPADVQAEALIQVLTGGRSSRWFEKLVKQERLAADVSAFTGPGDALPNLFIVHATPQGKATLADLEKAIRLEVARLRAEPVGAEELERAKKSLRADTIRTLQTNLGLAEQLAETTQISADPYYLERRLRQIEAVTPQDIQQFTSKYLIDDNLTVGMLLPPEAAAAKTMAKK